jgi:alpha-L-fucosidase
MRFRRLVLFVLGFLLLPLGFLIGSTARAAETYIPESDPLVLQKIEQWRDLKFGLLMHWGAYSQWGIVESWSICSEDEGWCVRKNPNYEEYKRQYVALKNTFNPIRFDPDKWARAAKDAGMKYVVFTTKHHDGFCMFDTKTTDYKITDPGCPYSINQRSNVAKEIFTAFRREGLWTGAYFSKPDWHSEDYWWPNFATPDRNVNYKISKYPDRWARFVDFAHTQVRELMTDYGPMDILWLDGGWVAKDNLNQDIHMDQLADMARKLQPGLIVVDRAVTGMHQDYLTPENQVPDHYIADPWESCITSGGGWAWTPGGHYMSPHKAIHTLCEIVAKGGSLLLNIGPGPDGCWDPEAYQLLANIGKWLKANGNAIYATRALAPYQTGKLAFTSAKNGTHYAIYLPTEKEETIPTKITLPESVVKADSHVTLIGDSTPLAFEKSTDGWVVSVPETLASHPYCDYAWTLKIQ